MYFILNLDSNRWWSRGGDSELIESKTRSSKFSFESVSDENGWKIKSEGGGGYLDIWDPDEPKLMFYDTANINNNNTWELPKTPYNGMRFSLKLLHSKNFYRDEYYMVIDANSSLFDLSRFNLFCLSRKRWVCVDEKTKKLDVSDEQHAATRFQISTNEKNQSSLSLVSNKKMRLDLWEPSHPDLIFFKAKKINPNNQVYLYPCKFDNGTMIDIKMNVKNKKLRIGYNQEQEGYTLEKVKSNSTKQFLVIYPDRLQVSKSVPKTLPSNHHEENIHITFWNIQVPNDTDEYISHNKKIKWVRKRSGIPRADVMGLAEVGYDGYKDGWKVWRNALKKEGYKGVHYNKNNDESQGQAIFYDENKFELVDQNDLKHHDREGYFKLPKMKKSYTNQILVYACLKQIHTGKLFMVWVTHLKACSFLSENHFGSLRRKQCDTIIKQMTAFHRSNPSVAGILMGDMNENNRSGKFIERFECAGIHSIFKAKDHAVGRTIINDPGAWSDYRCDGIIDFMFWMSPMKHIDIVKVFKTMSPNQVKVSDHCPLDVQIRLSDPRFNVLSFNLGYNIVANIENKNASENKMVEKCRITYKKTNGWDSKFNIGKCALNSAQFAAQVFLFPHIFGFQEVPKSHRLSLYNAINKTLTIADRGQMRYVCHGELCVYYNESILGTISKYQGWLDEEDNRGMLGLHFKKVSLFVVNLHAPHVESAHSLKEIVESNITSMISEAKLDLEKIKTVIVMGDFNNEWPQFQSSGLRILGRQLRCPSKKQFKTCCQDSEYKYPSDLIFVGCLNNSKLKNRYTFKVPDHYQRHQPLMSDHDPVILE